MARRRRRRRRCDRLRRRQVSSRGAGAGGTRCAGGGRARALGTDRLSHPAGPGRQRSGPCVGSRGPQCCVTVPCAPPFPRHAQLGCQDGSIWAAPAGLAAGPITGRGSGGHSRLLGDFPARVPGGPELSDPLSGLSVLKLWVTSVSQPSVHRPALPSRYPLPCRTPPFW